MTLPEGHVASSSTPDETSCSVETDGLLGVLTAVGTMLVQARQVIQAAAEKADQYHRRQQLLDAYRVRDFWRASDVRSLRSLGASDAAVRRASSRKGRGRPRVRRYVSLGAVVGDRIKMGLRLVTGSATYRQRRDAFFVWPWWKHHVEALYRGELDAARVAQMREAHHVAEEAVAKALRISQSKVHAICTEIRSLRRADAEAANFPPMRVSEFERWMETGQHPRHGRLTA